MICVASTRAMGAVDLLATSGADGCDVRSDSTRAAVDSVVSVSVSVSVSVDGVTRGVPRVRRRRVRRRRVRTDAESDDDVPPSEDPPPEPSSATARAGPKAIAAPTPTPAAASRNHVVHDIARMASPITNARRLGVHTLSARLVACRHNAQNVTGVYLRYGLADVPRAGRAQVWASGRSSSIRRSPLRSW